MPTGEPSPTEVRFAAMLTRMNTVESQCKSLQDKQNDLRETLSEFIKKVDQRFKDMDLRIELAGELSAANSKRGRYDADREKVFEFLKGHPGIKFTPALVEANLGAGLDNSTVGNKLASLHKAGMIQYGRTEGRYGVYWYEDPVEKEEDNG